MTSPVQFGHGRKTRYRVAFLQSAAIFPPVLQMVEIQPLYPCILKSLTRQCLYNCSVKRFSSHRTIPLAAFRCGRVSPGLTKRFSNPTTTLFQYWAVIPDIVVPIFLEKPAIPPTYLRQQKVVVMARFHLRYMIGRALQVIL